MKRTSLLPVVVAVLGSLSALGNAAAQGPLAQAFGSPVTEPDSSVAAKPAGPSGPVQLTFPQVTELLGQLGYACKAIDEKHCRINASRDGWTLPIMIELSRGGTQLWATIELYELEGDAQQRLERSLKLMAAGGGFSEAFFGYAEATQHVLLKAYGDNTNLSNADLKLFLDNLCWAAMETKPLWTSSSSQAPAKHVGICKYADQAKTIQLTLQQDGTFKLPNNGSEGEKVGRYLISDSQLALIDGKDECLIVIQSLEGDNMKLVFDGEELLFVRA